MIVLHDQAAEEGVAACAAHSSLAALAATDRLRAAHFHDPRCWAVLRASLTIPDERPEGLDPADGWWREDAVAAVANVWPAQLAEWCRRAPCAWDIDGRLADRVLAAHQERMIVERHIAALEERGIVTRWRNAAA